MSDSFDPYYTWLGIPPEDQPPSHYRLLGIKPLEENPDVIENAADQRMAHLRTFQAGRHSDLSQKLLNEVARQDGGSPLPAGADAPGESPVTDAEPNREPAPEQQPAERFVVLRKAMELAGAGGNAVWMLEIVDAIGADFEVDTLRVKDKVLRKFAAGATDTAGIASFVEAAPPVIEEALARRRYEMALELVEGAYRVCMRSAGKEFRKEAYQRRNEVRKTCRRWQEFRDALAKLKTDPDDTDAHLLVGGWSLLG